MPKYPKGILGVKKDPKNQILFTFNARQGDEWPSDDEDDSDYRPRGESDSDNDGGSKSRESQKRQLKNTHTNSNRKKRSKIGKDDTNINSNNTNKTPQKNSATKLQHFKGIVPSLPTEIWEKIFLNIVKVDGALPFLSRASKVCHLWNDISKQPILWQKVDLSFGWVNIKENTLTSICENRLSLCTELTVSGCAFMNRAWGVKAIVENCHNLRAINLSNCKKLPSGSVDKIVSSCKHLQDIDLSSTTQDAVSQQTLSSIAEKCGPNLKRVVISDNFAKGLNTFLAKLAEKCPNLEQVDMSNMKWQSGYTVDIESFQRSCPKLKTFYFANNTPRAMPASQQCLEASSGFPDLEELSLAAIDSNRSTQSHFLRRFVKNATKLRLIDLRGCLADRLVTVLKDIEATHLEQLYLARSQVVSCGCLPDILCKWQHSLTHLDLSWNNFHRDDLDTALMALCSFKGQCILRHINLSGTNVHTDTLKNVLSTMIQLESIDLSSCRDLDRGCKREYKTKEEIDQLRASLRL